LDAGESVFEEANPWPSPCPVSGLRQAAFVSGLHDRFRVWSFKSRRGLAVILLLSSSSNNPSLSSFKRGAEKAIGKPIKITYYQTQDLKPAKQIVT
jgi:hypothetical protein